jgi:5-methylcytosine-specific restriction endonuclease McrA
MSVYVTRKCHGCGRDFQSNNEKAARLMLAGKLCKCPDCTRGKQWTSQQYQEYLQTEHWQTTRRRALILAGHKCQLCAGRIELEVHHNSYERLGGELDSDLVVLCRECHKFHHARMGMAF